MSYNYFCEGVCSSVGRCVTATMKESAYRHIRIIILAIMFCMLYISRTRLRWQRYIFFLKKRMQLQFFATAPSFSFFNFQFSIENPYCSSTFLRQLRIGNKNEIIDAPIQKIAASEKS